MTLLGRVFSVLLVVGSCAHAVSQELKSDRSAIVNDAVPETKSPANLLGLSDWKLTLPVDTEHPGRPDEIQQPEFRLFVDQQYFFVNEESKGVVFRAPCGGITTKGSDYPRCELREMSKGGRNKVAWGTGDGGTHTMTMKLAITKTPVVKKHVVCAQIHNADDDVIMIRLEGTKLFVERNKTGDVQLDRHYKLGNPFELKIQANGGRIKVWYDNRLKMDWKHAQDGCYFKAGCYSQSNVRKEDAADSFGEVIIYRLKVDHLPQL